MEIEDLLLDIKNALNDLKGLQAGASISKVRAKKAAVSNLYDKAFTNSPVGGKVIHDDNSIILDAPEIIIGNVNKAGILRSADSKIVIRGNEVFI